MLTKSKSHSKSIFKTPFLYFIEQQKETHQHIMHSATAGLKTNEKPF
jgi:hypothetical protein